MARFRLSSSDKDFNSRVAGLFSCLDDVTATLPEDGLVFEPSSSGVKANSHSKRQTENTNETHGFKRPNDSNIPSHKRFKSQRRPDYVINPNKWTCYEMKDTQVLDEAQNKKAALQLMADLKKKTEELNAEVENCSEEKIVFKKAAHNKGTQDKEVDAMEQSDGQQQSVDNSGDFGGTQKFVMDEYVVGSKKKKSKNKVPKITIGGSNTAKTEVKLSYLDFEDDECA